ncbi:MAG: hypothetical protein ACYTGG_05720 [Planctomycetota bacterium]|jgi:hypothetical protein
MPSKKTKSNSTRKNSKAKAFKSPYATSFNNNIKKGTPFSVVIASIAKRTGKSNSVICNSLVKAGLCDRQKFNGQWVYWPCQTFRSNQTNAKNCQMNMWQWFVDWCICNKFCTPEQISNHCGSQKEFMAWCRKYWNRQFVATTARKSTSRKRTSTTSRKRTSTTSRKRTSTTSRKRTVSKPRSRKSSTSRRRTSSTPRSYKFPSSRTSSRRVRRAA